MQAQGLSDLDADFLETYDWEIMYIVKVSDIYWRSFYCRKGNG